MPTADQKKSLLDAITQIRAAEKLLLDESRSTSDPVKLIQINTEYQHLDSYLSQIVHAQALADDSLFNGATASLKKQVKALVADEDAMKAVVDDAKTAAKIAGFIAKAVEALAKL